MEALVGSPIKGFGRSRKRGADEALGGGGKAAKGAAPLLSAAAPPPAAPVKQLAPKKQAAKRASARDKQQPTLAQAFSAAPLAPAARGARAVVADAAHPSAGAPDGLSPPPRALPSRRASGGGDVAPSSAEAPATQPLFAEPAVTRRSGSMLGAAAAAVATAAAAAAAPAPVFETEVRSTHGTTPPRRTRVRTVRDATLSGGAPVGLPPRGCMHPLLCARAVR
jgi:hypothetical protein